MSEKKDVDELRHKIEQLSRKVQREKHPDQRIEAIERLRQLGQDYVRVSGKPTEL